MALAKPARRATEDGAPPPKGGHTCHAGPAQEKYTAPRGRPITTSPNLYRRFRLHQLQRRCRRPADAIAFPPNRLSGFYLLPRPPPGF